MKEIKVDLVKKKGYNKNWLDVSLDDFLAKYL